MLFNSYIFLFLFLPLTLAGYYLITKKNLQLWFLFLSSVFFYAYWSKTYVFLLLFTVVLDFYIARSIYYAKTQGRRRTLLLTSVIANLSILGFFKYYNFFADSVNGVLGFAHSESHLPILNLVLPIGISFYTFQSMSYVIDVYRRTSDAHAHLLEFAGYVTLFPHQISGPLVRHNVIVPQLESAQTYIFHSENFWKGISFFVLGLAKKLLIADRIAIVVDPLVHNIGYISNLEAVLAMFGYTLQLYFDFSGYSDMAVGLGLMMNIQFPQNFNSPYKSLSITDFWQRWHISLSSWLRDYLYISLGGNRKGSLKTYRNLFLTMAIGGLWHGANWTYVIWGAYHGAILILERFWKNLGLRGVGNRALSWVLTFLLINIGWVFFRAPSLKEAGEWLKKIFMMSPSLTWDITFISLKHKDRFFIAVGVGLLLALFARNTWEISHKATWKRVVLLGILFVLCLTYMGEESPFLYFQF